MARSFAGMSLAAGVALSSCAFLLDFDELQEGVADSGTQTGTGGLDSSGGSGGTISTGGGAGMPGTGGASGGATGGGSSGVSLAEAPAVVADVVCDKLEECAGTAAMKVFLYDEDCRILLTRVFANGMIANIAESVSDGTLSYNPEALPGCAAAYRALECGQVGLNFPEECKRTLTGLRPITGACTHSLECGDGLFCNVATCPGVCLPFLPLDSPCSQGATCAPGLTCFQGTCKALGRDGEACGGGMFPDCVTGLLCVGQNDRQGQAGKCFPAKDLFVLSAPQSCNFGDPPALCREGFSCPIVLNPRCVAQAPSLGMCQGAFPDMCPTGEYCGSGTCTPLPGPGENCAVHLVTWDAPCRAYQRCVDTKCRPLGENGNTCIQNEECYSGLCSDARCVPPRCP